MSNTLILHIGHFKTGTTALQVFFERQESYLKKCDLIYPDIWKKNSKHSAFAFSILREAGVADNLMHNYQNDTPPQEMWNDLYQYIENERQCNFIVSSEEFVRIGQYPAAQKILRNVLESRPANLKVKVIIYLRDPDSHLHSWYNQLVKMNVPVSDFNSTVAGEIEEIHIDYQRAIEPWVGIVGAENVIIRPYVKESARRDALHRDFMSIFGHELPEGLVDIDRDPNPRLDDRMIELVRLMQNMKLPKPTINTIRVQAQSYLDTQDSLTPEGAVRSNMQSIRERSVAGLKWVDGQPGSSIPMENFSTHLPQGMNQEQNDNTRLIGFVLLELVRLRQRVNNSNLAGLISRVEALEARLNVPGENEGPT